MRSAIILLISVASLAATQSTTSPPVTSATISSGSGSDCDAQNIVDACVAQYDPQLADCKNQDYECMCAQATNLLSCYNNCPDATDKGGADSKKAAWCDAWSRSPEYTKRANSTEAVQTATATSTGAGSITSADSTNSPSASSTGNSAGLLNFPSTGLEAFAGIVAIVGLIL